ncbi:protein-export protein SecB, partial [Striga asiatica]
RSKITLWPLDSLPRLRPLSDKGVSRSKSKAIANPELAHAHPNLPRVRFKSWSISPLPLVELKPFLRPKSLASALYTMIVASFLGIFGGKDEKPKCHGDRGCLPSRKRQKAGRLLH